MAVYLLHFDKSIGGLKHQSQHYCGFSNQVEKRMNAHLKCSNVPIVHAFREQGISFKIGKLWLNKDRIFERHIKQIGRNIKSYCLICREENIIRKQL